MSLAPKMLMAQRQALVMTPQLQQAIKLLQLNQIELAAFIEAELEQNPLLVRADEGGDREAGREDADEAPEAAAPPAVAAPADEHDESAEPADPRDEAAGATMGDTAFETGRDGGFSGDDEFDPIQALGDTPSLRRHLLHQIGLEFADPGERLIAISLTDMLDGAGYLTGDLAALAELLGVATAQVDAVLQRLQRFEPAGLYARSLSECLALQLADRNRLDPAMQALLDNLDLVARRDLGALMRRCGVDAEDLAEMVAELRRLDPKPGHRFDAPPAQPIVPDIFLRPTSGGWTIELNTEVLPRVLVNRQYYATLGRAGRDKAQDKAAREFISERMQTANWLVKALDQRANTILRVAREVVRQQDGFFRRGVSGLKPLVLRDIAQEVELHESTISRVTANKYMATPRGIFELKYFFTSAVSGVTAGSSVTSEAVRDRIRLLIDGEPPGQPLSDDRLVDLLQREGVAIARRTVAKYRDTLGIASSAQRRRDKALVFFARRGNAMQDLRKAPEALSAE